MRALTPCSHSLCNLERKLHKTLKKYTPLPSLYHLSLANATLSHFLVVTGCLWPCFLSSHLFHLVKVCCGMSASVETSNAQLFVRRAGSLRPGMCAEVSTGNGFPQSHMLIIYPGTEGGSLCNPWSLLLVRLSLVERGNIYAFEDEVTVSWGMQKEVSQAFMWNVLMNEQSFRRGSCDCELVRSGRVWWWMQDLGLTWWWGLDGWKEWGCHLRETAVNHPEVRP